MRCLYCGKHLPLFRKLTGGGEFCSDAHREQYHDEYNRLAVSRLLQAQSRPEEARPAAKAAAAVAVAAPVAVEVETEAPVEVSSSFLDEFTPVRILPTPAIAELAPFEIDPVFTATVEIGRLSVEPEELRLPEVVPPPQATLVAFRWYPRQIESGQFEGEAASASQVLQVFPALPETPDVDRILQMGGVLPLRRTTGLLACRSSKNNTPELGNPVELSKLQPLLRRITLSPDLKGLPKAASVRLTISAMESDDGSTLDIAGMMRFTDLLALRPAFDLGLTLHSSTALEKSKDPVEKVTPTRVLKKLSQLHIGKKPTQSQAPASPRTLKHVDIPAMVPSAAVLAAGFEGVPMLAKPRLLLYTTHPLRPKMAVGTASGPVAARPVGYRSTNGRKLHLEAPKIMPRSILDIDNLSPQPDAPRITPKSMLHLDEEFTGDSDNAIETASLFGKIGGLFGKKQKHN